MSEEIGSAGKLGVALVVVAAGLGFVVFALYLAGLALKFVLWVAR